MTQNPIKLHIEKPIYGGSGLARHEGKAIFVPFTLPGESVEANITQDHGSYANADLVSILEPAPARTAPACPHYGDCGGCHYQHAAYPQQLEFKSQILRESLDRAHIANIPAIPALSAEPLAYRNRIRLHIDRATSQLAYKRRASNQNLIVTTCPIAAPALQSALHSIQSAAPNLRLGKHFTEIELFTNTAQDAILLSLFTSSAPKPAAHALESLWPQLQSLLPQLTGTALFSLDKPRQPGKLLAHHGQPSLTYTAAGRDYRVSAGGFFQVNRFLIDPLVEHVTDQPSGALAWDLYAGSGLFSAALASRFQQVIAVESAPASVHDLRHNLRGASSHIVASTTLEFLRRAAQHTRPDLVLVDPPRAGLGSQVTTLLAAVRPARITYVSCDPATLSRDLKSLLDSGYHLSSMLMADLFPQTFHMESVATLALK
ncbi:MAG TPA: 23S rRNA (uracil(1939)-C(5))-methyltransferase RlmD [Acidobacteriaceae bacterium]|nr:23S rRNA (uracil(1939)-C(5))-methyltransferase RlmD [Acidobacteriaceae bacterium]